MIIASWAVVVLISLCLIGYILNSILHYRRLNSATSLGIVGEYWGWVFKEYELALVDSRVCLIELAFSLDNDCVFRRRIKASVVNQGSTKSNLAALSEKTGTMIRTQELYKDIETLLDYRQANIF